MGGGACVIIIEGNGVQGDAAELSSTAVASCQLVDYLSQDEDEHFDMNDAKPIENFHLRARPIIQKLKAELDSINRALAAKYNRPTS